MKKEVKPDVEKNKKQSAKTEKKRKNIEKYHNKYNIEQLKSYQGHNYAIVCFKKS